MCMCVIYAGVYECKQVSIHVDVCAYKCVCLDVYLPARVCLHVCTCACNYVYVYMCVHVCVRAYVYMYVRVLCSCMSVHVSVLYMYINMHECGYMYVCIEVYACMHMNIQESVDVCACVCT